MSTPVFRKNPDLRRYSGGVATAARQPADVTIDDRRATQAVRGQCDSTREPRPRASGLLSRPHPPEAGSIPLRGLHKAQRSRRNHPWNVATPQLDLLAASTTPGTDRQLRPKIGPGPLRRPTKGRVGIDRRRPRERRDVPSLDRWLELVSATWFSMSVEGARRGTRRPPHWPLTTRPIAVVGHGLLDNGADGRLAPRQRRLLRTAGPPNGASQGTPAPRARGPRQGARSRQRSSESTSPISCWWLPPARDLAWRCGT